MNSRVMNYSPAMATNWYLLSGKKKEAGGRGAFGRGVGRFGVGVDDEEHEEKIWFCLFMCIFFLMMAFYVVKFYKLEYTKLMPIIYNQRKKLDSALC